MINAPNFFHNILVIMKLSEFILSTKKLVWESNFHAKFKLQGIYNLCKNPKKLEQVEV